MHTFLLKDWKVQNWQYFTKNASVFYNGRTEKNVYDYLYSLKIQSPNTFLLLGMTPMNVLLNKFHDYWSEVFASMPQVSKIPEANNFPPQFS